MSWYYCDLADEIRDGMVYRAGVIFNFFATAFVYAVAVALIVGMTYTILNMFFTETKFGKACVYHWKHRKAGNK